MASLHRASIETHAPGALVGGMPDSQIRSLRERFITDPMSTDLSALRPVIARSWQRSLTWNVMSQSSALASASDPRVDDQLLLAAEPVLNELERVCVDVGGSVVLTDADGTLAMMRGHASEMRRAEHLFPLAGANMAEDAIGTNSDGTALEENRAVQVWGAEHFNDALQGSYCTSVPIRDPIRRSIRGVLGVMLPDAVGRDVAPRSVLLLVEGAAADITRRLAERLAAREQALLAEYMREARKRGADAVVAMDDRTTIASRSALSLLGQADFAVLSALAREAAPGNTVRHSLSVSDGRLVDLHVRPMDTTEFRSGGAAVMRVHVSEVPSGEPRRVRSSPRSVQFEGFVGASTGMRRALDAGGTAVARKVPAYILGERGTGKRALAIAIASALSGDVVVIDFPHDEGLAASVDSIDNALARGSAVVLHRVDRAPASTNEELAALFLLLEQPQVLLTASTISDAVAPVLSSLRGIEISIPPLRSRREDIPTLAGHFLKQLGRDDLRLSSKLRDALVAADWPGNVEQLRDILQDSAADVATSEVRLSDLSDVHLRALQVSRLSRLEEAELRQIRDALIESRGNRVKAASLLGVSRSTLYRKIDTYVARGFDIELE